MNKTKALLAVALAIAFLALAGNALAGCIIWTVGPRDVVYNKVFTNVGPDQPVDANGNPSGHKFVMDGNMYVIPSDTILTIEQPITQFVNICVDGSTSYVNPRIRAYIIDPITRETMQDNTIRSAAHSCEGNPICFGQYASFYVYHFMRPGLYTLRIEHSLVNRCIEGYFVQDEDSVVRVINPLLSINGSASQAIAFNEQNEMQTTIYWTVKNISDIETQLFDANMPGCDTNKMTCNLRGFVSGMKLLPNQSVAILEEITIKSPASVPQNEKLGLDIKYGDTNALVERRQKSQMVDLNISFEQIQRFSVKLFAKNQFECIGANDEFGQTGADDAPKILLSWDWSHIQQNGCDQKKNASESYIYCDPAQFSIELLRKLSAIEGMLNAKKRLVDNDIKALTDFKAYLIGDNYSDDFRKDFDYYYLRAGFFNAESFYTQRDFNKYFTNSAKLEFKPKNIESGLYSVQIDINADINAALESLFADNQPGPKITVKFTKIKDPLPKNPLYYLPFNGDIGKFGADADGQVRRKDYGLAFSGAAIALDNAGTIKTESNTGAKSVQTIFSSTIAKTNLENRGMLLKASKNSLEFAPNKATPVLAKITASNQRAEMYYILKKQTTPTSAGKEYLGFWTGIASSMGCQDFFGKNLFYNRRDANADETNCTQRNGTQRNAFGFEWPGSPTENEGKELFLQTVFFTPTDSTYFLENACTDANAWFYGPNSSVAATSIALDYPQGTIESVQKIIDLVKTKKACIAIADNEMKIWWNMEEISKALAAAKAQIPQTQKCSRKT